VTKVLFNVTITQKHTYMAENGFPAGRGLGRGLTGEVFVRAEMTIHTCEQRQVRRLSWPGTLIILTNT